MKFTDKELGMDRSITRRDFLDGAASIAALAATTPAGALAAIGPAATRACPPASRRTA